MVRDTRIGCQKQNERERESNGAINRNTAVSEGIEFVARLLVTIMVV